MKSFSQRIGVTPAKNVIQVDSMDNDLRNSLWNAFWDAFVELPNKTTHTKPPYWQTHIKQFARPLWRDFFKHPIDTIPDNSYSIMELIKNYFFKTTYMQVYNFIDFTAHVCPNSILKNAFIDNCNRMLERELSAYRFVDELLTPITSEEEIAAIEGAINNSSSIEPVSVHLKRALELFADRKSPDYRNSIKESISAVEAVCRMISGKNTLSGALKEIEKNNKVDLHPALNQSFEKLYAYTNDAEGIRHALLDEPNLDSDDAKFMLVSCSAFINYLKSKAAKSGIKF